MSGSEPAFAHQVTQEVRQWGAYRTTCATANGLPADNQYSTAQDLALMFRRAMSNPELAKIMSTKYYTIQGDRELRNHNRFLFTTPLAVAGKDRVHPGRQAHLCGACSKTATRKSSSP